MAVAISQLQHVSSIRELLLLLLRSSLLSLRAPPLLFFLLPGHAKLHHCLCPPSISDLHPLCTNSSHELLCSSIHHRDSILSAPTPFSPSFSAPETAGIFNPITGIPSLLQIRHDELLIPKLSSHHSREASPPISISSRRDSQSNAVASSSASVVPRRPSSSPEAAQIRRKSPAPAGDPIVDSTRIRDPTRLEDPRLSSQPITLRHVKSLTSNQFG